MLTAQRMSEALGFRVSILQISNRALDVAERWSRDGADDRVGFDWRKVKEAHREPKRLELSMWAGDRLCGLALCLIKNSAVEVRFLEGAPAMDCPLKGRRILVALDCAANYAQACGRSQIRLQPINEGLAELYERDYGFTRVSLKGQEPFFKKEV